MNTAPSSSSSALLNALPGHPEIVIRVGFAGSQRLPEDDAQVQQILNQVFEVIAERLRKIVIERDNKSSISRFYSKATPTLRLITGLCEGADALAAREIERFGIASKGIVTKSAAIIPFPLEAYRNSRAESFRSGFDELASKCEYIQVLDGIYEKPEPDTPLAKNRRARAYRAQSTVLLRHCDLMIATANPDEQGKAGGTMETVRSALGFELPVVFIHTGTSKVSLLEPEDDPATAFSTLSLGEDDWKVELSEWVATLIADPDVDLGHTIGEMTTDHGNALLDEFFTNPALPELKRGEGDEIERSTSVGERCWTRFKGWFEPVPPPKTPASAPKPASTPKPKPKQNPFLTWRKRTVDLNYHYSGSFRGTFLVNYTLAACAVACAALSLVLIGEEKHTAPVQDGRDTLQQIVGAPAHKDAGPTHAEPAPATHSEAKPECSVSFIPHWLNIGVVLLVLGGAKLVLVGCILVGTHKANHGDWNDKAVDYRYLAERLRTMLFLPRIGSFQPPAAAPPQYASRVVRQSAVDWLFDAILRSHSPAEFEHSTTHTFVIAGESRQVPLLHVKPLDLLNEVRVQWIAEQAHYHDRNARTMERMHKFAEGWGTVFNYLIIGFVIADIVITIGEETVSGAPSHSAWQTFAHVAHRLHCITPWLVFMAALLPALVASLNGIRFQSECRRLAERSAVMRTILRGRVSPKDSQRHTLPTWKLLFPWIFPAATLEKPVLPIIGINDAQDQSKGRMRQINALIRKIQQSQQIAANDLGAWTGEALLFTERIAEDFVQEVAEWSVLYAKEMPEP